MQRVKNRGRRCFANPCRRQGEGGVTHDGMLTRAARFCLIVGSGAAARREVGCGGAVSGILGGYAMRKAILFVLVAGLSLSSLGCVVYVVDREESRPHPRIVEIDGELYVVDRCTQKACKVSADVEGESQTTTETQIEGKGD